jgi:hypothetical protein
MRMLACASLLATLAMVVAGCGGSGKGGSTATGNEIVELNVKLDLPEPPAFEDPKPNPDGTHSVTEMRRKGGKFLDQVVHIKGYVVFKYDCVAVLGEKVVKETPDKCDRPHFYLADAQNASHDKALWVVEVPRAPREDEKKVLPKEELNDPTIWPPEPKYAQGDLVDVEGTWATKSPKGFVNSDGLVVYKNMTVITPANPEPEKPAKGKGR